MTAIEFSESGVGSRRYVVTPRNKREYRIGLVVSSPRGNKSEPAYFYSRVGSRSHDSKLKSVGDCESFIEEMKVARSARDTAATIFVYSIEYRYEISYFFNQRRRFTDWKCAKDVSIVFGKES